MTEPRGLDPEAIDKLRLLVRSSAWVDVVKPILYTRKQLLMELLMKDPAERGEKMEDASIRGRIRELEWILTRFDQQVEVADHNRRIEERDAATAAASP